jgi:copper chaperone CopZ
MAKLIVDVPSMYGDHHVLVVRNLLTAKDGVTDVYASSAFRQVLVHYEPDQIQPEAISALLEDAGYTHEMDIAVQGVQAEDAWKQGSFRMTQTHKADRVMSGEQRNI